MCLVKTIEIEKVCFYISMWKPTGQRRFCSFIRPNEVKLSFSVAFVFRKKSILTVGQWFGGLMGKWSVVGGFNKTCWILPSVLPFANNVFKSSRDELFGRTKKTSKLQITDLTFYSYIPALLLQIGFMLSVFLEILQEINRIAIL